MGGCGSGRNACRPKVEECLNIDLGWLITNHCAIPGSSHSSVLTWTRNGERFASLTCEAYMYESQSAHLTLCYLLKNDDGNRYVKQKVRLTCSRPNFGGRRWWMICPRLGVQVCKLYLPPGGDKFESRRALDLAYHSQSLLKRDRPFEALGRLQRKLGGSEGWALGLAPRPKGMHHQTYQQLVDQYFELDDRCAAAIGHVI